MFKTVFFILSFLILIFNAYGRPKIRVRIKKNLNTVLISGLDLKRDIPLKGERKTFRGHKSIRFNCRHFSKKNPHLKNSLLLASLSSPSGVISLKKEHYRGKLDIITSARKQGCDVVHEINIEDYLSTLLAKEMNGSWPIEVLKAQAIAARTYAFYKMRKRKEKKSKKTKEYYDLESSEKHQVSGNLLDITRNTKNASFGTSGLVLMNRKGDLTPTFFHAQCGGRTLRPDQVWGNTVAGYRSVKCPFCKTYRKKHWKKKITSSQFRKFLSWAKRKGYLSKKLKLSGREKIKVLPDKISRTKLRIYIGKNVFLLSKVTFRKYFGRFSIGSNHLKVSKKGDSLLISGNGLGHGVGLCQLGALQMAKEGYSYKKILAHYFPGHRVKKIY